MHTVWVRVAPDRRFQPGRHVAGMEGLDPGCFLEPVFKALPVPPNILRRCVSWSDADPVIAIQFCTFLLTVLYIVGYSKENI